MHISRTRGSFLATTFMAGVATATMGGLFLAAPASAQDYSNVTAAGHVQGTDGAAIANATVEYKSNDQGFVQTVRTDGSGNFKMPQTKPGSYTVTITADGFTTYSDSIDLTLGQTTNQFTLASAGAAAAAGNGEIVVRAGRVKVNDFERNTVGAVVNVADLQKRVPIARNITSVILLAPGTNQGDSAFGNVSSISGSSVSENQFFVNGLDISDQRNGLSAGTVPFEFFDTVDVKTGGYPAEFGRSTGGFISATTKSGSNEFHGGAVITESPDKLASETKNTYAQDNKDDYRQDGDAYFWLSGPIIKDHLFFYGFYDPRYLKQGDGSIVASRYDTVTSHTPYYGGKIDAVIVDGQRLEFTIFNSAQTQTTDSYSFDPTTHKQGAYIGSIKAQYGGLNYVGRYTGKFTDWFTLSAAYGVAKNRDIVAPSSSLPYIIDNRSGTAQPIGNSTSTISANNDKRTFYRGDADFYFKLLGSHHIRAGYDREDLVSKQTDSYVSGQVYQYFNASATSPYDKMLGTQFVSARVFDNNGTFKSRDQAFYIEDNWSLWHDRVTLNLGIRDDKFNNKTLSGATYYKSGDQWGPRLGFTFDPVGNGRSKIYGSFSRYFLPVPTNTNIRLGGAELDYTTYNILDGVNADGTPIIGAPLTTFANATTCGGSTVANCRLVSDGLPGSTESLVSKNLKPQSKDEYILGGEQRIGQHMRVGLYGTYRKLNRSLEDSAIDQAVLNYCTEQGIAGCEDIWTGFHQYVLNNPGAAATITLSDPINGETTARTVSFATLGYPKAKNTYKAVTATFDREFNGVWSLSASYTWSKSKGNIEGGVKSDNGQTDAGLTQDFDQPGLVNGSYGYLPNDRRHNFKIYGSYQLTPQILIGANFQLTSPRHFGCIGLVPENIDPFASAYGAAGNYCPLANGTLADTNPIVLVPRGTVFHSNWNKILDMSMVFTPIKDNNNISFQVNAFNILNLKSKLDFDENGTDDGGAVNATYRLPTTYQNPRSVRLTLRVGF